ncbi:MAG: hypothetical protein ABI835_08285 [Chloroflexota bacterium]
MLRQRTAVLLSLLASFVVMALTLIPSGAAFACLPCACPDNTAVNCWGDYQLYTDPDENGDCTIDIWIVQADGTGKQALELTAEEIADLPAAEDIDRYVLIGDAYNGYISLYKLQTDQYQLNVGPDGEGKVHTINWAGCPAEDTHEDSFLVGG